MPRRSIHLLIAAVSLACILCSPSGSVRAQTIDADDCRDQAYRLRREARDLADATDSIQSDSDASAAQEVRRQLENVRSRLERTVSACGSRSAYPAVIASIRRYLLLRHQDNQETRARLLAIDDALVTLAQTHVRVQPGDYRMTYAMAETVFTALGK